MGERVKVKLSFKTDFTLSFEKIEQSKFTYSMSATKTAEQCVNFVQS